MDIKNKIRELRNVADKKENSGECIKPLYEVDWQSVHALEDTAPMRIIIPLLQSRARSNHIKELRKSIANINPIYEECDSEWMSYVFIYRNGIDTPIPTEGSNGLLVGRKEKWRWLDPQFMFMGFLHADIAAIYKIEDINHTKALLIWSRYHHLLAQTSEKDCSEIFTERCMCVSAVRGDG